MSRPILVQLGRRAAGFVAQSAFVADLLLVFLKLPVPGAAKTRLVPHLGPEAAAELYRVLAEEEVRATAPRPARVRAAALLRPRLASARPSPAGSPARSCGPSRKGTSGHGWPRPSRRASGAARGGWPSWAPTCPGSPAPTCSRPCTPSTRTIWPSVPPATAATTCSRCAAPSRGSSKASPGARPWSCARPSSGRRACGLRVATLETLTDVDTLDDVRLEWPRLPGCSRAAPICGGRWPGPWAGARGRLRPRARGSGFHLQQGEELLRGWAGVAERPFHAGGHRHRVLLLHPAHHHAEVRASMTTPTPWGSSLRSIISAICTVSRSCTWSRRANMSTRRGILERPTTFPLGM